MAVGSGALPEMLPIKGIELGVAAAGIKKPGKDDLVIIRMSKGTQCAGVFTQNRFCAAPVRICKDRLAKGFASSSDAYMVINTGNANAGTGKEGMADALDICLGLAETAGVPEDFVLPFSTGVIGERLPVEKIKTALPEAFSALSEDNWRLAAQSILTTDTRAKGASCELSYGGHQIRITGMSKGSGMIKPNMATMLAFIATDAKISPELTADLVRELSECSFNRITVDGDTSTNDACMLMATGQSSAPEIDAKHPDFSVFKEQLKRVFIDLAQAVIRDGEGATKLITIRIDQAANQTEALEAAYTIAHSPLVKTAFFASDPNWGRILAALGRADVPDMNLDLVEIYLDDVRIVTAGGRCPDYTEDRGQAVMDQEEIMIVVKLGRGDVSETIWTSDLSHGYVTINAEYRT